jgi:hypothetical protein
MKGYINDMKRIGIIPPFNNEGHKRILNVLGSIFNISFKECNFSHDTNFDAYLQLKTDGKSLSNILNLTSPCLSVLSGDLIVSSGAPKSIVFSKHSSLPEVLRGRNILTDDIAHFKLLSGFPDNATILATKEKTPIYAKLEGNENVHYLTAMPLPELAEGESIFQYFHGGNFLPLLPFILFIKNLLEDRHWGPVPLRACFMFDDPNLHWHSYGFLKYSELLQHAQTFNYHISFATIPLDGLFVHRPTASLFKKHGERLSLVIHGNNHTSNELARHYQREQHINLFRQSLYRISNMERRTGIGVDRIMVPPHGACSEASLYYMHRLGFEAACISKGSLMYHNIYAKWIPTLGLEPSAMIQNLPVLFRSPISTNCYNNILVSIILDQPIILRAHHQDVSNGLQILDDIASFINSIGDVNWMSMTQISRSHYVSYIDGDVLNIKMFTRQIEIFVPAGVNRIQVFRPWLKNGQSSLLFWRYSGGNSDWYSCRDDQVPFRVVSEKTVTIKSNNKPYHFSNDDKINQLNVYPIIRRILTEGRDRIAPLTYKIYKMGIKNKIF